jgi:probable H4MPT-linked C1 transfer pathway protein
MTGELCDCFETKRDGVRHILVEVERAFPEANIRVWSTAGRFVAVQEALEDTLAVAAANWYALATFCGRRIVPTGPAILIDVGSTTTDIIPILDGVPCPVARTDPERLRSKELLYTGVRRTPICALVQEGVAAELFATTLDAYLVMEFITPDPNDCQTADGRPATVRHAEARLSRMLGGDAEITSGGKSFVLALLTHKNQRRLLLEAVKKVEARMSRAPRCLVFSGSGEFLARAILVEYLQSCEEERSDNLDVVSLQDKLGPQTSAAACAYAVAVLAENE